MTTWDSMPHPVSPKPAESAPGWDREQALADEVDPAPVDDVLAEQRAILNDWARHDIGDIVNIAEHAIELYDDLHVQLAAERERAANLTRDLDELDTHGAWTAYYVGELECLLCADDIAYARDAAIERARGATAAQHDPVLLRAEKAEAEAKALREVLAQAEAPLAQFVFGHPKWTPMHMPEQDPLGAHAALANLRAALQEDKP